MTARSGVRSRRAGWGQASAPGRDVVSSPLTLPRTSHLAFLQQFGYAGTIEITNLRSLSVPARTESVLPGRAGPPRPMRGRP